MRSPADDDEGKAPLAGVLEYQSSEPLMRDTTVRGFESLVIVMMEVVSEIADSFRSGCNQSLVDRMQCVIEAKGPRVNKAVQHASADVMLWMHQGGFWRTLLVSAVRAIFIFLCIFIAQNYKLTLASLTGSRPPVYCFPLAL